MSAAAGGKVDGHLPSQGRRVLILRPEPGASATAARAQALGFATVTAPLFAVRAVSWDAPNSSAHDALMFTSANAPRHAGPAIARYRALPAYTVGTATAAAAREAGFTDIRTGDADAGALLALMAADGVTHPLHLAGREHRNAHHPALTIDRRIVYAADAVATLAETARAALAEGAIALLHSPRSATLFASLMEDRAPVAIAAISPAAAEAAGQGWRAVAIAASPDDAALLQAADSLPRSP
jgi:uroporphyrinogen-III synthase